VVQRDGDDQDYYSEIALIDLESDGKVGELKASE
jgi:hypothetical protein